MSGLAPYFLSVRLPCTADCDLLFDPLVCLANLRWWSIDTPSSFAVSTCSIGSLFSVTPSPRWHPVVGCKSSSRCSFCWLACDVECTMLLQSLLLPGLCWQSCLMSTLCLISSLAHRPHPPIAFSMFDFLSSVWTYREQIDFPTIYYPRTISVVRYSNCTTATRHCSGLYLWQCL